MTMISAELVKNLREKTGAGMMECKKALTESNGEFEKAVDLLRQKGLASAVKKAGQNRFRRPYRIIHPYGEARDDDRSEL